MSDKDQSKETLQEIFKKHYDELPEVEHPFNPKLTFDQYEMYEISVKQNTWLQLGKKMEITYKFQCRIDASSTKGNKNE